MKIHESFYVDKAFEAGFYTLAFLCFYGASHGYEGALTIGIKYLATGLFFRYANHYEEKENEWNDPRLLS